MAKFDDGYAITLKNEWGYTPPSTAAKVNKDPGGETFDGIDRRDNSDWTGWEIIDAYKSRGYSGKQLVQYLRNDAVLIAARDAYYRAIWYRLHLDEVVDQSVANNIFDAYINPGPLAVKIVQEWCGVAADGAIGKKTIAAVNAANKNSLIFALYTWKKNHYNTRSEKLKEEFLAGWMDRAEMMRNA